MAVNNDPIIVPCPHCDTLNRVARAKLGKGGRCGQCHQPLFTGHPLALGKERFERHLDKGDLPLLIDFWAPWCGPCRAVTPVLEQIAGETEKVEFVKLDIDQNPVTASRYDVLSIPTVILFADGEPRETVIGARKPGHFRQVFERFLVAPPAP